MRLNVALLWITFAALIAVTAYQLLLACDLGRPIFGFRYCEAGQRPQTGATDDALRERSLRERLHAAELRLAELPACTQKPERAKEPEPEKRAKPPKLEPIITPPSAGENLKIPTKLEDLKGCWQSDRGDIDIVTDDEKREFIGHVRICLCYGSNGRGEVRYLYTDGDRCIARATAKIEGNKLSMRHERASCRIHNFIVPSEILCSQSGSDATSCDKTSLGKMRNRIEGEKYHKVDNALCEWQG